MKILIFLFCCFFSETVLFAQHNIVKNGDFKEVEKNYASKFRRIDIQASPKHWNCISLAGIHSIKASSDVSDKKFVKEWDKIGTLKAQEAATSNNDILVGISTRKWSKENPFSRRYIVGILKYKLKEKKKYKISIQLFLLNNPRFGMETIGVKFDSIYPNVYDLSPRINNDAINIKLPNNYNKWLSIDTIIEAQGYEKYLTLGYFELEEKFELYSLNRRGKRKKSSEILPQVIVISKVSIEALDSSEWALLAPKEDSLPIDSPSIVSPKIPQKTVQTYQKNYQANFAKNSYDVARETLQNILKDLQALEARNSTYHLYLTGHTDDEGSLEANEKLSKLRAEAVQNWFLEKHLNPKQITIDYKGERALLGADAAENRRVEIRLEYQAVERILME